MNKIMKSFIHTHTFIQSLPNSFQAKLKPKLKWQTWKSYPQGNLVVRFSYKIESQIPLFQKQHVFTLLAPTVVIEYIFPIYMILKSHYKKMLGPWIHMNISIQNGSPLLRYQKTPKSPNQTYHP